MLVLYKPNIDFITTHSVDPDMRRNVVVGEAPRHFIDIDNYGIYPYTELSRKWSDAVIKYGEDTLLANGIVPWHVQTMLYRLTEAFKAKNFPSIMKNSADIGHYIADAHVPLHTSSNHNGQLTNQKGIHGFWESRVPELLADKEFDFYIGKAQYIKNPGEYIWARVLESAKATDAIHEVFLAMEMIQQMFANMNPVILYDMERNHPVTFQKFLEHKHKFLFQVLKDNIERGKKEELYRADINTEVIAKIRLETMMMPFNQEIFPKAKFNLVDLERQLIEHYLFGVSTMKGYKLILKYQQQIKKAL
jgi:hypothetical protein